MKSMRVLGSMIEKLALQKQNTLEDMGQVLDCTPNQVKAMYKGRVFPSFAQLEKLATYFGTTVDALLNGDEEYYENKVVHCMEHFVDSRNREDILDIIYDYLDVCDAVSQ